MTRRGVVAVFVATVLVVAALAVVLVVRARSSASDGAARVAQRYAELVASGAGDELDELARLTSEPTPALADAAPLLAAADERIEVVGLGEPEVTGTDQAEVAVRYRLAGEEHTWTLRLGRDADDDEWRVAAPMTGAIAWDEPALRNADSEIRLGGAVVERRPRFIGGGDDVQPLYPAGYAAEKQVAPYFAAAPVPVVVLPGEPTPQPELVLRANDAARQVLAADLAAQAGTCGTAEAFGRCPFYDIVATPFAGGDPTAPGWWKGFAGRPTLTVDAALDGVAIEGAIRYATPGGVRTLRFTGDAEIGFDRVARTPTLSGLEVEAVG
ncbi:hypothetical protein [Pimelobacter simplex]|uniref:hypothetical protein n=1 Tax=Nocardioides simplex TaxID=2045 RepID=UPI003AAB4BFF